MHALLFDRRSLMLTGAALAGLGAVLFAAGFVLGVTVTRGRELVPPRWVEYGPLPPEAARLQESPPPPASPAGETSAAAVEETGPDEEKWVPFARPDEVEELLAREIEAPEEPAAEMKEEPPVEIAHREPPAEPSVPAPVEPVVHNGSWYVQTGAFSVPGYARAAERELESRFADRPYRPYLEEITDRRGRLLLTVRLGPFPSRDAANAVAADFDDVLVRRTSSSL